jgi:Zn-dependent M28 family amino/carboxypeptidase
MSCVNGLVARSDHFPFWLIGIPALMLTDTANYRNPHYHTPGDTLETLDPVFAARSAQAAMDMLRELAGIEPVVKLGAVSQVLVLGPLVAGLGLLLRRRREHEAP